MNCVTDLRSGLKKTLRKWPKLDVIRFCPFTYSLCIVFLYNFGILIAFFKHCSPGVYVVVVDRENYLISWKPKLRSGMATCFLKAIEEQLKFLCLPIWTLLMKYSTSNDMLEHPILPQKWAKKNLLFKGNFLEHPELSLVPIDAQEANYDVETCFTELSRKNLWKKM